LGKEFSACFDHGLYVLFVSLWVKMIAYILQVNVKG
jgi:hypothetical protein